MGKKSNLTHQAIKELNKECHFGQSKYEAKQQAKASGKNPALVSGIYSQATYNSYLKVGKQFIADTISNHREVKALGDCRKYVKEFLEKKEEAGVSAWTLHQYGSALAKIYHCSKNDFDYDYPARNRADIKRCRCTSSSDYRSPEEKWDKDNLRGRILPNGICGQPESLGACPAADACLTCQYFKTSKSFLPILKNQLDTIQSRLPIYEANNWIPNIETAKEQISILTGFIERLEEKEDIDGSN